MCNNDIVSAEDILLPKTDKSSRNTLEQLEKSRIEETLKSTAGNVSKAAVILGLTRQALYRRMEKFGIKA